MAHPEPEGVTSLPGLLEWFREQDECRFHGGVEIAEFEYQGRGMRATSDVTAGTALFCCPLRMLLSAPRARADPQLGPALAQCVARDDDALALLLLHERRKGAESEAACHIKSLPVQYDQTLFWTEAELAEIEGSNVLGITRQLSIQTRQDYDLLTTAISAAFPELSIQEFGYEDYCWALATIWSRSMDIPVPDTPGGTLRIISPVADMFNTDATAVVCHGYDASDRNLKLVCSRDTAAGEQFVIGYGPVTNSRCLWLYGFALAANPHDAVELYATMSSEISAYERRMELLRALGIESLSTSAPHLLKASQPLPPSLLQSLRVQRAPKKLLKTWLQDPAAFAASVKAPDITLEREILDALRVGVVRMLEAYPTTLEEDEEAEMRWAPHTKTLAAVSAYRYRMALLLRLSEKRILRAAVAKIDAAFNQLNLG